MFKRIIKFLLGFFLLIAILTTIAVVLINKHLASNKTKILDNLEFLNHGSISFEATEINAYQNFPSATITLNKFLLKDSLFDQHQLPLLQLDQIHMLLSLHDLLTGKIEIQTLEVNKGKINVFTDLTDYNNLNSLFSKPKKASKKSKKNPFWKDIKLKSDQLKVSLTNIELTIKNAFKTSCIQATVKNLNTTLDFEQPILNAQIVTALAVKELTFNKKNGTFIANSLLGGTFNFEWNDSLFQIHPFELGINDEKFLFSAAINPLGTTPSLLVLENDQSRLAKILPLLPNNIRKNLLPYKIPRPFLSKTTIQTSFKPKENPVVEVSFAMDNQDLLVHEIPLNHTKLQGKFINRLAKSTKGNLAKRKQFSLIINGLTTEHKDFWIQSDQLTIVSSPATGPKIKVDATIDGPTTAISDWFNNDQFFFEKGTFNLLANINGSLEDLNSIIVESNADLILNDFSVIYDPANVSFPFQEMTLQKEVGNAFFTILNTTFVDGHDLFVNGGLKNLPALMLELANQKVTSEANISSKKLSWTDFINFFGENGFLKKGKPKSETEKKRSMKSTVKGFYNNFQPKLAIKIDTLAYYDLLQLAKFQTNLHFENEHTLVLDKTSFEYDKGTVDFSGTLDISAPHLTPFTFELHTKNLDLEKALPPLNFLNIKFLEGLRVLPNDLTLSIKHEGILDDEKGLTPNSSTGEVRFEINEGKTLAGTITYQPDVGGDSIIYTNSYVNTKIKLSGNSAVFNNFFKTEQFIFEDGKFEVDFDYKGNLGTIEELLANGKATFSLGNSAVYYEPVGVTFPLSKIDLQLHDDKADYEFLLKSDSLKEQIALAGNIDNLSELIIGGTGKQIKTEVQINSPKITWKHFLNIFSSDEETDDAQSMKASLKGILNTFDPHFHVAVDTFVYSDKITVQNVSTGVHLRDSATMVLEKTKFDFEDGIVKLEGEFDLGQPLMTPFDANIKTDHLELHTLLESLDYLALPSLKNLKKLEGSVSMDFDLGGIIDDKANNLIGNATTGIMDFNLNDVVLVGLGPLDAIASRLRMEKRFQELRFAPIDGQIKIKGQEIEFPLLEIQSNAIHLFMEGILSYGELTNIWVSIPFHNLRRADRSFIPEKTGYAAARRKVYIEVTSDEDGNNQFKFRLTKRKFYKSRGIFDQYRKDKRKNHLIRKQIRKGKSAKLTAVSR